MLEYSINWFRQREKGKLKNIKYTGSLGTSPEYGMFYRPIFEYKVEVIVVNDSEAESHLRGECSVKEYRIADVKRLSPMQEKEFVGLTKQNLEEIDTWLDEQFFKYKEAYHIS